MHRWNSLQSFQASSLRQLVERHLDTSSSWYVRKTNTVGTSIIHLLNSLGLVWRATLTDMKSQGGRALGILRADPGLALRRAIPFLFLLLMLEAGAWMLAERFIHYPERLGKEILSAAEMQVQEHLREATRDAGTDVYKLALLDRYNDCAVGTIDPRIRGTFLHRLYSGGHNSFYNALKLQQPDALGFLEDTRARATELAPAIERYCSGKVLVEAALAAGSQQASAAWDQVSQTLLALHLAVPESAQDPGFKRFGAYRWLPDHSWDVRLSP